MRRSCRQDMVVRLSHRNTKSLVVVLELELREGHFGKKKKKQRSVVAVVVEK